ncbi:unnamed protein product [Urochloa humidicola]
MPLLLTLLPLALAAFAFALQWRGGMRDPAGAAWPSDKRRFLGIENSPFGSSSSAGADCAEILDRSTGNVADDGLASSSRCSSTRQMIFTGFTGHRT